MAFLSVGYAIYANRPLQSEVSGNINTPPKLNNEGETAGQAVTSAENQLDRIVGEDVIAIPDFDPGSLERLPARKSLSHPETSDGEKLSGSRLLYGPVATAAGLIEAQGIRIRLAGIEPTLPDMLCGKEPDLKFPCGKMALTAFRAWLRGRAIECDFAEPGTSEIIEASCSVGGRDAAAWLVKNGWAKAHSGGAYASLESAARSSGSGIFATLE
ncbi:MAG: thermonuclease family protein [Rhizobiaceae bacterium]